MSGYGLDAESLKRAADGINQSIDELRSVTSIGRADTGNGFEQLQLTGVQAGNEDLRSAFEEFCTRWSAGVRSMVQDGSAFAQSLHRSAGVYRDLEEYGSGVLKNVLNDLGGNPHSDSSAAERASWGQLHQGMVNDTKPDHSAESLREAGAQASRTWRSTGRDFVDNVAGGLPKQAVQQSLGATGSDPHQLDRAEDQLLGPARRAE